MSMASMTGVGVSSFPYTIRRTKKRTFLKAQLFVCFLVNYPSSATDVVLIVDGNNNTNINALKNLGFDVKDGRKIRLSIILSVQRSKLLTTIHYYTKLPTGNFIPNT
jgi:putative ABC transport system permease protein